MKKLFFTLQIILFAGFNIFLLLTAYQLVVSDSSMKRIAYDTPVYNLKEEFNPSLQRLNSIDKMLSYCDSLYTVKSNTGIPLRYEETYPQIVLKVVRERFYHGYSVYGFNKNFMAMVLEQMSIDGLSAIVVPDDILKYPYAACSQQSIVMMDMLGKKDFFTRKVGFKGKKYGHFCFETFYNGSWHFYDPNMEPDLEVLQAYNQPNIAFLATHKEVLLKAYKQYPEEKVMDIFTNYSYGSVNSFPAPKAMIFQKASMFLSYTLWAFFLVAFIWARRKYKKLSNRMVVEKVGTSIILKESMSPASYKLA